MTVVTGYTLRSAIKVKMAELAAQKNIFERSKAYFPSTQEKPDLVKIGQTILGLETDIAELQDFRDFYNNVVMVKIEGVEMRLNLAIKLVGGFGRLAKMWRVIAEGDKKDRLYSYRLESREKDTEYEAESIHPQDALAMSLIYEKHLAELKMAISVGNSTQVDINGLPSTLLG